MKNPAEDKTNMAHLVLVWCCLKHKEERYGDVILATAQLKQKDYHGWVFNAAINEEEPWCSYRD